MTNKTQFAKIFTLLNLGLFSLSVVALNACESEYPQRKKPDDRKLNLDGSPSPSPSPSREPDPDPSPSESPEPEPEPEPSENPNKPKPPVNPIGEGGNDGEKLDIDEAFVCQSTALVSIENGRTNCFVRKDTAVKVSTAVFIGKSFVEVTLKDKVSGCTMLKGRLFGAHVSKTSACEKTLASE